MIKIGTITLHLIKKVNGSIEEKVKSAGKSL